MYQFIHSPISYKYNNNYCNSKLKEVARLCTKCFIYINLFYLHRNLRGQFDYCSRITIKNLKLERLNDWPKVRKNWNSILNMSHPRAASFHLVKEVQGQGPSPPFLRRAVDVLLPPNLGPVLSHPNGPSGGLSSNKDNFFSRRDSLGPGVKMLFFILFLHQQTKQYIRRLASLLKGPDNKYFQLCFSAIWPLSQLLNSAIVAKAAIRIHHTKSKG